MKQLKSDDSEAENVTFFVVNRVRQELLGRCVGSGSDIGRQRLLLLAGELSRGAERRGTRFRRRAHQRERRHFRQTKIADFDDE